MPIPANVSAYYRKKIDWDGDGKVRGSYERYMLWQQVVALYTLHKKLADNPRAYSDPALRQKTMRKLERDLKTLYPFYAHLPQVDFAKQTVRVGTHVLKMGNADTRLSQKMLFLFGEAFASLPVHLARIMREKNGLGRLKFRVKRGWMGIVSLLGSVGGVYEGWPVNPHTRFISIREKVIDMLANQGVLGMGMLLFILKHEVGHAVDHQLGYELIRDKQCTIQSMIPLVSAIKIHASCESLLKGYAFNFRSQYSDLIDISGVNPRSHSGMIHSSFLQSLRALTVKGKQRFQRPLEWFANGYVVFTGVASPWTKSLLRVGKRIFSTSYERFFQNMIQQYSTLPNQ